MAMSITSSAAVMNDSIVLIFSGMMVNLCVRDKVANSIPYLLSLATTANMGLAYTMEKNQNILIISIAYDDISWTVFLGDMVIPVTSATAINATIL